MPCWNTRVANPKAAPTVSRFISTENTATTRLRNTTSSSRKATSRISPIASGALPVRVSERSWFWAAGPPTLADGAASAITALRSCTIAAVASSSTAVEPVTRTTVRPLAAGSATIRASTTRRHPSTVALDHRLRFGGVDRDERRGCAAPSPKAATIVS